MEVLDVLKSQPLYGPEKIAIEGVAASRDAVSKGPSFNEKERSEPASAQSQDIVRKETEKALETLKDYMDSVQTDLKIQVHQETGKIMVKIVSKDDGKVVREVPPEELLNLSARIKDMMGVLFDKKV